MSRLLARITSKTPTLLRSSLVQVKWETNKYADACNAPESTYAGVCNALYLKVPMQRYAMQCIGNYTLRYLYEKRK